VKSPRSTPWITRRANWKCVHARTNSTWIITRLRNPIASDCAYIGSNRGFASRAITFTGVSSMTTWSQRISGWNQRMSTTPKFRDLPSNRSSTRGRLARALDRAAVRGHIADDTVTSVVSIAGPLVAGARNIAETERPPFLSSPAGMVQASTTAHR